MKYCIESSSVFDTPAKNEQILNDIKVKVGWKLSAIDNSVTIEKPHWGIVSITSDLSEDKEPMTRLEIRFDKEVDIKELVDLIKGQMIKIPVLKGWVKTHLCGHDEGKPCINWEEYVKV